MTRKPWLNEFGVSGTRAVTRWIVACSLLPAAICAADTSPGDCVPGEDDSPACIEMKERLAEERLEQIIENPEIVPGADATPAAEGTPSGAGAAEAVGRFPQIRVPLGEDEPSIEVKPNPPPVEDEAVPPPHDAEERGLDPLTE